MPHAGLVIVASYVKKTYLCLLGCSGTFAKSQTAYKVSSCVAPLLEKAALALTLSVCGRVGIGPCKEPLHSWADSWALAGGSVPWLRSPEAPHSEEDTEGHLLAGVPSFLGLCPPGAALTNPSGESGLVPSQPPGPPLMLSGPCSAEGATPAQQAPLLQGCLQNSLVWSGLDA